MIRKPPVLEVTGPPPIRPQPGPQSMFFKTDADIAVYGGAAGGGKTWALLNAALRYSHIPGFVASIFRLTESEIKAAGGMWGESIELYSAYGSKTSLRPLEHTFPSGAKISFRHLDGKKSRDAVQGAQFAMVGIDEGTQIAEDDFWYVVGRNRSQCGIRPHVRVTCNPDPSSFLAKLISWWIEQDPNSPRYGLPIPERSGVKRLVAKDKESGELVYYDEWERPIAELRHGAEFLKSLTFIPATTRDNAKLLEKNPGYMAALSMQSNEVRAALEDGNWLVRWGKNAVVDMDQTNMVSLRDLPHKYDKVCRVWDFASTEGGGDYTVGQLWGFKAGKLFFLGQVRGQWGTKRRNEVIENTIRRDFVAYAGKCEQVGELQPGAAGAQLVEVLDDIATKAIGCKFCWMPCTGGDKVGKSEMFRTALANGDVYAVDSGEWREMTARIKQFPKSKVPDDEVDTASMAARRLYKSTVTGPRSWSRAATGALTTQRPPVKSRPLASVFQSSLMGSQ